MAHQENKHGFQINSKKWVLCFILLTYLTVFTSSAFVLASCEYLSSGNFASGSGWTADTNSASWTIYEGMLDVKNVDVSSYARYTFDPAGFFTIDTDIDIVSAPNQYDRVGIYVYSYDYIPFTVNGEAEEYNTDGVLGYYYPKANNLKFKCYNFATEEWVDMATYPIAESVNSIGLSIIADKIIFRINGHDTDYKLTGDFEFAAESVDTVELRAGGSTLHARFDNVCASPYNSDPIPPDNGVTTTPFTVTEATVNDFFPMPDFPAAPQIVKRSYDPFGGDFDWFQSSTISTRQGGVRITGLVVDDISRWLDLQIDLSEMSTPLKIINSQIGDPTTSYPDWEFGNDVIDFRMSNTEIYGPPAYLTMFNLGLNDISYDIKFLWDGSSFAFAGTSHSGYIHYFPSSVAPELGVVSNSLARPVRTDLNKLCFANLPFGAPIAIFNVDLPDGEDYLKIGYCSESELQKFSIRDGIAVGIYLPPAENRSLRNFTTNMRMGWWPWASTPTLDEKLDKCIETQTRIALSLGRENEAAKAVYELVFAIGNKIKLSSTTLDAAKTALVDGKDVWYSAFADGSIKPEDATTFILTTLVKNAPPKELKKFRDAFFNDDANIPAHIKNLASGTGTASESDFKLAWLGAITKDTVKAFFPLSAATVKAIKEGRQWNIEVMADERIQGMYKKYKEYEGDWEFINAHYNTLNNPNINLKVKQLLWKQDPDGKEGKYDRPDDIPQADIDEYVRDMFEHWNDQDKNEFPAKKRELEKLKKIYTDIRDYNLKHWMPNTTVCERLEKLRQMINHAQLDLVQSMGACKETPSKSMIRQVAIQMVSRSLKAEDESERKRIYQERKLRFLENYDCNNIKTPGTGDDPVVVPPGGGWVLTKTLVEKHSADWLFENQCYVGSHSLSDGSFTYSKEVKMGVCNHDEDDYSCLNAHGNWTQPSKLLIPGNEYPISCTLTRTSKIIVNYHFNAHLSLRFCQENENGNGRLQVSNRGLPATASWSGTFRSPGSGDQGDTTEIEVSTTAGYVYYTYTWNQGP
ncbi:MAG: hypothetical protein U9R69_03330 [Thermodesulfobacteriota bacterium]|nr:hypothetical protein [Thermodesulfobacteriota bacterium]